MSENAPNCNSLAERQAASEAIRNAPPIITITSLRKVYRIGSEKVIALGNVDLTIRKGEVCCLLGTSGSGKSTLLNMIAGLEKPTRGTILIRKQHVETMNERKLTKFRQKNMGFVFQSYNLLSSMTALENVSMPLMFQGVGRKKRDREAKKMLDFVGLKTHMKHRPTQMSGGQQQRVGIARAFIGTPPIILADEPTGNLDTKTTADVMELMINTVHHNNETLIIVTHDSEIAQYADHVIHIRDGNIVNEEYQVPSLPLLEEDATEPEPIPAAN